MKRYSAERKASVIQKMMPPHNTPIPELVAETGIPDATLYTWRKQARVDFGFQIDRTFHSPKHGLGYELERKKVSLTLYEFGYLIELGNAPAVVFKLVFDGSFETHKLNEGSGTVSLTAHLLDSSDPLDLDGGTIVAEGSGAFIFRRN